MSGPDQEAKIEKGSKAKLAHDIDVSVEVVLFDAEAGRADLKFGPSASAQAGSRPPERLSLVPFNRVDAAIIQDSIAETAAAWRNGDPVPQALIDFLCRQPPRVSGHPGVTVLRPDEDITSGTDRIISNLDHSCLVIQGSPGSGKTWTAARAIVGLLDAGRSVGITSNSHKAIEKMLATCNEAHPGVRFLRVGGDKTSTMLAACVNAQSCDNSAAFASYEGGLIGGTTWLFAREEWRGAVDHLFVDEAGQVSLANLVGMARSARNLVLLGDQMQLSQPIQGTHPGESGLSLLNYYLQDHATIPEDLGIFLPRTWRLHPAPCRLISEAVCEGRLTHEPVTGLRRLRARAGSTLLPQESGIVFVPVEHEGNSQASDEEVDAIRRVAVDLMGRDLISASGSRPLTIEDIHGDALRSGPAADALRRALALSHALNELEVAVGISPARNPVPRYAAGPPGSRWEAIRQGESTADEERGRQGLGASPIGDLVDVLNGQGIRVAIIEMPDDVSRLTMIEGDRGFLIAVNRTHAPLRQRFSLAHELAHVLLDYERLGCVSRSSARDELAEVRANSLAAAFLMPEAGVRDSVAALGKGRPSRTTNRVFDGEDSVSVESREKPGSQDIPVYDVLRVAHHFGVSVSSALYRLLNLRVTSEAEFDRLQTEANSPRARCLAEHLKLQVDTSAEPEATFRRHFLGLALESLRREAITRRKFMELAQLVGLGRGEVPHLLQDAGFPEDGDAADVVLPKEYR